jgi:hypothetical protein
VSVTSVNTAIRAAKENPPSDFDPYITGDEAASIIAAAEADGTVDNGEAFVIVQLWEGGTRESQSVTAGIPELGGDGFYLSNDAVAVIDAFFVKYDIPYGSNTPVAEGPGPSIDEPRLPEPGEVPVPGGTDSNRFDTVPTPGGFDPVPMDPFAGFPSSPF